MRALWLGLIGIGTATAACAQSVSPPHLVVGDDWVVQNTVESRSGWRQNRTELTIERVSASSILLSSKQVGSTMPPTEALVALDWSRVRNVNGHETLVNRPLGFPLSPGKTWDVDYTEQNPNRAHASEHFHTPYKVVGWENVTVPAGTFRALKVEAEGTWEASIAPAASAVVGSRVDAQGATTVTQTNRIRPGTISGRTYKAFWYVPDVKRWAKSVEEYYDGNGVRTERFTQELESWKAVAP